MTRLTRVELIEKYRRFFASKGHVWLPSAPLLPENDPTVLFTTAGMHPLVPYLMGEKHPEGRRLANVQKCLRTDDIEEVGDGIHHTFFEMLGNWSLGDYGKKEAIGWSWQFLTEKEWLGLDKDRLAVSVFRGDENAPLDEESISIWKDTGLSDKRIARLGKKENWWGPVGATGPCGPDTEIFYWTGEGRAPAIFDPQDKRWVEIWNNVFMIYDRQASGEYLTLKQKNVDTGMGLVRVLSVVNRLGDDYLTDPFWPLIEKISQLSRESYQNKKVEYRVIADHLTAAVLAIADGIAPANKEQGYIIRRLIRRAIVKGYQIDLREPFTAKVAEEVRLIYQSQYSIGPEVISQLEQEEGKFRSTLERGLTLLTRRYNTKGTSTSEMLTGKELFDLFQTYGFPLELSLELAKQKGIPVSGQAEEEFRREQLRHQDASRTAAAGRFKGGLASGGEMETKYHTATHLLLAALREELGREVSQKGANITAERMRFDFSCPEKLTQRQINKLEARVNEFIKAALPVSVEELSFVDALKSNATTIPGFNYPEKVKVYTIGEGRHVVSREVCGGPHVKNTGELGRFRITKEESSSQGVRRIRAVLE